MNKLEFLDPRDAQVGFLSNFYRATFELNGARWPTLEHAYQAAKFADIKYAERIRNADTPRVAKIMGQTHEYPLHANWELGRNQVMLRLVAAKFCLSGNAELMVRLLGTKGKVLIEASPTDSYWGAGANGEGANHLGRTLMAVRDVLLLCDYENMRAKPPGDSLTLHALVVAHASRLLSDSQWSLTFQAPAFAGEVTRDPLYGQGTRQLSESLRPWLGVPLAACWVEQSWRSPQLILQTMVGDAAPMGMHYGLHLYQYTSRRMGYRFMHTVVARAAYADWREPCTATEPMPPWKNILTEGNDWSLQAVSIIKTSSQDPFDPSLQFEPATQGVLLSFCTGEHCGVMRGHNNTIWRYVALYAVHDEGFEPQVCVYQTNPALDTGTPYGMPWEVLL